MSNAAEAQKNEGGKSEGQWACDNGVKEGAMQEWEAARLWPIKEAGEVENNIGITRSDGPYSEKSGLPVK